MSGPRALQPNGPQWPSSSEPSSVPHTQVAPGNAESTITRDGTINRWPLCLPSGSLTRAFPTAPVPPAPSDLADTSLYDCRWTASPVRKPVPSQMAAWARTDYDIGDVLTYGLNQSSAGLLTTRIRCFPHEAELWLD